MYPDPIDLLGLHRRLNDIVLASSAEEQLIHQMLELMLQLTNADVVSWWALGEDGTTSVLDEMINAGGKPSSNPGEKDKGSLVNQAVREDRVKMLEFRGRSRRRAVVVAVPVLSSELTRGAFTIELSVIGDALDPFVVILQLIAGYSSFWQSKSHSLRLESEAKISTSLLELTERVAERGDIGEASILLVNQLSRALNCERVGLSICGRGVKKSATKAISGFDRFDRNSEFVMGLEAAFAECCGSDGPINWPPENSSDRRDYPAHAALLTSIGNGSIVTMPLTRSSGELTGALCFVWRDDANKPEGYMSYIRASALGFAPLLWAVKRGSPTRVSRALNSALKKGVLKNPFIRVCLALVLSVLLFVPMFRMPVRIDCQLRPVASRTVCAPFDGILESSMVRIGDVVEADDPLAQMDGSEIKLVLAGSIAERYRARKMATQSLAKNMVAAEQMAEYEREKLDQDIKLLERRVLHLEVKAPIAGMVLSGELDRAEGAPLSKGQKLFEIAPLDKMLVELLIPDSEVSLIENDHPVAVRLDSYPGMTFEGRVLRIRPASEIRDMKNVFIAEAELVNDDGLLRPGMKGRAVIKTRRSPLVWQVLHVPLRFLISKMAGY